MLFKVTKILKGSLDSIPAPSPSVKMQIMGGKVCLSCIGKKYLAFSNGLPQVNFPANDLNLKVMGLNPGCLLKYYLLLKQKTPNKM